MERSFLPGCHCPDPDSVDVRRIDFDFPSVDRPHGAAISSGSASINRGQETGGARDWNAGRSEPRCANSAPVVRCRSSTARGSSSSGGVANRELLASERTAQIAQSGPVLVGIVVEGCCGLRKRLRGGERSGNGEIAHPSGRAEPVCAASPWKCPNDSANWIASANSASREPCLRCFRNQFTTSCAFPERPRCLPSRLGRPMLYYNIGRERRSQP